MKLSPWSILNRSIPFPERIKCANIILPRKNLFRISLSKFPIGRSKFHDNRNFRNVRHCLALSFVPVTNGNLSFFRGVNEGHSVGTPIGVGDSLVGGDFVDILHFGREESEIIRRAGKEFTGSLRVKPDALDRLSVRVLHSGYEIGI